MKKNIIAIVILMLVLTVDMLSGCIQERYTIDEKGFGKDYYIEIDDESYDTMESIVKPVIIIIIIGVIIWVGYELWKDYKEKIKK